MAARNLLFWFPVFVLYFTERVRFDQVLTLEAIYYACVVVLEVPSGYLSDRISRTVTLRLATTSMAAAYAVFLLADDLLGLAIGQALLAAGMAFQSGTDSALHYDSLAALGREHEFADRESRALGAAFGAVAAAAVIGGLAGGVSLTVPYVLSAAARWWRSSAPSASASRRAPSRPPRRSNKSAPSPRT